MHMFSDSSKKHCKPFIVDGDIIGNVPPYVFQQLESYDEVFRVTSDCVSLNKTVNTSAERTCKINNVLQSLRKRDIFCALKGWRNEVMSGKFCNEIYPILPLTFYTFFSFERKKVFLSLTDD